MMPYPVELTTGDKDSQTGELPQFFKERGWDVTWDFNSRGYWHEVLYEGKMIMQIEFGVTVEDMMRTIKELVPEFDETVMDPSPLKKVLDLIMESGGSGGLYIWPSDRKPQRSDI